MSSVSLGLGQACLTPAFRVFSGRGRVHSVFSHAANMVFTLDSGEERMLSLFTEGTPEMPDCVCVRGALIAALSPNDPASFSCAADGSGTVSGFPFSLSGWTGRITPCVEKPDPDAFLRVFHALGRKTGFDFLPPAVRARVTDAILAGDIYSYLGLGPGLTPSADDAAVGFFCAAAAMGRAARAPAREAVERTTDVSARYLRLASEGYFSRSLLDVARAAGSGRGLPDALRAAAQFGATSGMDALFGFYAALRAG